MNGDINPDPAVELLASRMSYESRDWLWFDEAHYADREDWREEATDVLIALDALRAERLTQTDQNSVAGTTTPISPESG